MLPETSQISTLIGSSPFKELLSFDFLTIDKFFARCREFNCVFCLCVRYWYVDIDSSTVIDVIVCSSQITVIAIFVRHKATSTKPLPFSSPFAWA